MLGWEQVLIGMLLAFACCICVVFVFVLYYVAWTRGNLLACRAVRTELPESLFVLIALRLSSRLAPKCGSEADFVTSDAVTYTGRLWLVRCSSIYWADKACQRALFSL